MSLNRPAIARKLLAVPFIFVWLILLPLLGNATTIRDTFLSVEWRAHLQVLDYLPRWSSLTWVLVAFMFTVALVVWPPRDGLRDLSAP